MISLPEGNGLFHFKSIQKPSFKNSPHPLQNPGSNAKFKVAMCQSGQPGNDLSRLKTDAGFDSTLGGQDS